MSILSTDYYWRDGYLVRRRRPILISQFTDSMDNDLFTAKSSDPVALEQFGHHAVDVLPDTKISRMWWGRL